VIVIRDGLGGRNDTRRLLHVVDPRRAYVSEGDAEPAQDSERAVDALLHSCIQIPEVILGDPDSETLDG
jgi:hypothetical protein